MRLPGWVLTGMLVVVQRLLAALRPEGTKVPQDMATLHARAWSCRCPGHNLIGRKFIFLGLGSHLPCPLATRSAHWQRTVQHPTCEMAVCLGNCEAGSLKLLITSCPSLARASFSCGWSSRMKTLSDN